MSLIHWWPLNEDLNNRINGKKLTQNIETSYITGKLGKAIKFNGHPAEYQFTSEEVNALNQNKNSFSIACWIKLDSSQNGWGQIITLGDYGTDWNNIRLGLDNQPNERVWFTISNGTANMGYKCGSNSNLQDNQWHHLVGVYSNRKLTMYVDGVKQTLESTSTFDPAFNLTSYVMIGGNHNGEKPICAIADVRVYDHTLSQAEIQELSKALVLHYTFDDVLAEPTTNLLPASLQNKYVENVADAAAYSITSDLTPTAYTLTANIKRGALDESPSPYFSLNVNYTDGTSENITTTTAVDGYNIRDVADDQFHTYQLTIHNLEKKEVSLVYGWILDRGTYTPGTPRYMTVQNAQLEAKDHATPYTSTNREGMLYNETGLMQPNNVQNINLSTNAAIGVYSLDCNNTLIRNLCDSSYQENYTISTWIYPKESYTGGCIAIGGYYLKLNASGTISTYCYGRKNSAGQQNEGYFVSSSSNPVLFGQWNHIAIAWDANGCNGYINGKNVLTVTNSIAWNESRAEINHYKKDIATEMFSDGSLGETFNGLLDDFRIYNSCLSPEEIKELYNCGGRISNLGDAFTGEFIEGAEGTSVNKNHTITTKEIYEQILPSGYQQLEYIETDGAAYINTTYNSSLPYQINCDMEITGYINGNYWFGQQQNGSRMLYNGFYSNTALEFNWLTVASSGTRKKMTQTLISDKQVNITINNISYQRDIGINGQGGDLYIFACRTPDNSFRHYGSTMRVYSFTIHQNGIKQREFIPARQISNGALGLYDIINNQFYINAGSGEFTAGPALTTGQASMLRAGGLTARQIIEI